MNKKWSKSDIWLLCLQIISIVVSIIVTLIPEKFLSDTIKLTIICATISIPIIIVQITITVNQNKTDDDLKIFNTKIDLISRKFDKLSNDIMSVDRRITQIAKLFQVCSSPNERIRRFADRRITELAKFLETASQQGDSGKLNVTEYYAELNYLADKLEQDINGDCKIWAMTGFAPDEWSAAGGYEKAWTNRLQRLLNEGIITTRICLLSDEIINFIMSEEFEIHKSGDRGTPIEGFISLLKQYYSTSKHQSNHYVLLKNEFPKLEKTKGFFGIVLSDGDKYIIQGEAINVYSGLTGTVLFDINYINELFSDFTLACQEEREIINYINSNASESFRKYLANQGIIGIKD